MAALVGGRPAQRALRAGSPSLRWARQVAGWARSDAPLAALDGAIALLVYVLALVLRFDGAVPTPYWEHLRWFAPLAVLIHLSVNTLAGLYGQMWRYASATEARRLIGASLLSTPLILLATTALGQSNRPLPLSVTVPATALTIIGFGAVRFHSRLFAVKRHVAVSGTKRILIAGAGRAGAMIARDVQSNRDGSLELVGFLDDAENKIGRRLQGVSILGSIDELPDVVGRYDVDDVVLAVSSADATLVRRVAALCEASKTTLKILPSIRELVQADGSLGVGDLRDVRLEDLLFRSEVTIDLHAVRSLLSGRRVLITGAGGSIGSEIARQVLTFDPAELLLLDHDETHLHDLVLALPNDADVRCLLADIRDRRRIRQVFESTRPDIVFHAAAHKHVPILEQQPAEAVLTNVSGTAHVLDAARAAGVQRFVHISTDKAINPQSVMGATKWLAERIVASARGTGMTTCAIRFGNVLGSRGSVVPTFMRQIEAGGPVTVTDENMVRYFMSIGEAVQLVLQSASMAKGGETFTLDMGEPVRIVELAHRLIRLSGRIPGKDIEIRFIGRRPGEKLAEQIHDPREQQIPGAHPSITVAQPPDPDIVALRRAVAELEAMAESPHDAQLGGRLLALAHSDSLNGPAPSGSRRRLTIDLVDESVQVGSRDIPDDLRLHGPQVAGTVTR